MTIITPHDLHHLLATHPDLPLLDVRTPSEFADVHVPAARNLPLGDLDATILAKNLEVTKPVYLICASDQRSRVAATRLIAQGFLDPVVVEGGTQAWIKAGLPVTRGKSAVISLERQVRIAVGSLVLSSVLLGQLVHPALGWLAGLFGGGLIFAGITGWCGLGLLLARFPWNRHA